MQFCMLNTGNIAKTLQESRQHLSPVNRETKYFHTIHFLLNGFKWLYTEKIYNYIFSTIFRISMCNN